MHIDTSTLHWLACAGVFLVNFLIYEFIVFGAWMLAIMPAIKSERISEDTEVQIMNVGITLAFIALLILVILYIADVFRLIPLPK